MRQLVPIYPESSGVDPPDKRRSRKERHGEDTDADADAHCQRFFPCLSPLLHDRRGSRAPRVGSRSRRPPTSRPPRFRQLDRTVYSTFEPAAEKNPWMLFLQENRKRQHYDKNVARKATNYRPNTSAHGSETPPGQQTESKGADSTSLRRFQRIDVSQRDFTQTHQQHRSGASRGARLNRLPARLRLEPLLEELVRRVEAEERTASRGAAVGRRSGRNNLSAGGLGPLARSDTHLSLARRPVPCPRAGKHTSRLGFYSFPLLVTFRAKRETVVNGCDDREHQTEERASVFL
ncbi:hypothetical protein AGIG_G8999 [Arapaima gigas]